MIRVCVFVVILFILDIRLVDAPPAEVTQYVCIISILSRVWISRVCPEFVRPCNCVSMALITVERRVMFVVRPFFMGDRKKRQQKTKK